MHFSIKSKTPKTKTEILKINASEYFKIEFTPDPSSEHVPAMHINRLRIT